MSLYAHLSFSSDCSSSPSLVVWWGRRGMVSDWAPYSFECPKLVSLSGVPLSISAYTAVSNIRRLLVSNKFFYKHARDYYIQIWFPAHKIVFDCLSIFCFDTGLIDSKPRIRFWAILQKDSIGLKTGGCEVAGTLAEEDWLVRLCLSLWLRSTPDILSIKSWNHTSSSIMMLSSSLVAAWCSLSKNPYCCSLFLFQVAAGTSVSWSRVLKFCPSSVWCPQQRLDA